LGHRAIKNHHAFGKAEIMIAEGKHAGRARTSWLCHDLSFAQTSSDQLVLADASLRES
jgi:hypothetical protein